MQHPGTQCYTVGSHEFIITAEVITVKPKRTDFAIDISMLI